MSALPTIPQYIEIGKGTVPIMADYQAQGALFGTKLVKPQSPQLVAIITDSLTWGYEADPTDEKLQGVGAYLLWLCGQFGQMVQSGQGGGTVIPINPATTMPDPVEFVVDGTSLIVTGGSTLLLTDFIGYNIIFLRNNIPQTQINTGGSYYHWNRGTGVFTCFGAAGEDELFSINAV